MTRNAHAFSLPSPLLQTESSLRRRRAIAIGNRLKLKLSPELSVSLSGQADSQIRKMLIPFGVITTQAASNDIELPVLSTLRFRYDMVLGALVVDRLFSKNDALAAIKTDCPMFVMP